VDDGRLSGREEYVSGEPREKALTGRTGETKKGIGGGKKGLPGDLEGREIQGEI